MHERLQPDYRFTELEPDLLPTPFKVQTNWHVITGTVSSGKTTLIEQLAAKGFKTVPEPGRQYFESEMAKGRTIDEIRKNPAAMTQTLIDIMLEGESELQASDVLFLDRAFPDALAFCRTNGLNPNEILCDCFQHRYASVFLLDRFPVEKDGIRAEDDVTAELIDEWLARDYSALGYDVVRVPVLSLRERLAFVLEWLSDQGLI
jgi:predicted ATPase